MADAADLELKKPDTGAGTICALLLDDLPEWFGIPEANAAYATAAQANPTVVASADGAPVGILTTIQHSETAAEILVMAVRRSHHRHGVGAAMLRFAERHLAENGIRFLQVKTLADTHPDPGYSETRAFYRACGFEDLEIFPTLWDTDNPALQMIKTIPS